LLIEFDKIKKNIKVVQMISYTMYLWAKGGGIALEKTQNGGYIAFPTCLS